MEQGYKLSYLDALESESIHIIREVWAEFEKPVLLYSVGKDSSVLLRLVQKAFYPGKIPFPLMHVDTSYKFTEMIEFRDMIAKKEDINLIVHRNENYIKKGMHPSKFGMDKCCKFLKTQALLDGLSSNECDAAIGGARREEEKSRAKERIFSFRDEFGAWDPKNQRPELWSIYNSKIDPGESVRIFPLSNWTEIDIWQYIKNENMDIVPLYFAKKRKIIRRDGLILLADEFNEPRDGEKIEEASVRFRTLGCSPCSGAIESDAATIDDIIGEVMASVRSERENRAIDYETEGSMEDKKKEGYF
ncbi:MAG: sulfate adenylyltransferase subunit CysD [Elusimicrobia bacterium]|jgi:sulfate adenylyltransferase subunit 2|nr:sulfate adenylyltransferase subunit CysD [Elusimicrobiota bacterium]